MEKEEQRGPSRGGGLSMMRVIGASNHCAETRADGDYYATPTAATRLLCGLEELSPEILEPACGGGHIARVLEENGHRVTSRDLVDRGYGQEHGVDFLSDPREFDGDLVTNPPYSLALDFAKHALDVVKPGRKVVMFLKLTFAEGKARKAFFEENPPRRVWVSSSRLGCGKNGADGGPSAVAYAWWVWEKGYKGPTEMKWFN